MSNKLNTVNVLIGVVNVLAFAVIVLVIERFYVKENSPNGISFANALTIAATSILTQTILSISFWAYRRQLNKPKYTFVIRRN